MLRSILQDPSCIPESPINLFYAKKHAIHATIVLLYTTLLYYFQLTLGAFPCLCLDSTQGNQTIWGGDPEQSDRGRGKAS